MGWSFAFLSLHTTLLGLTFSAMLAPLVSPAPSCPPARLGPNVVNQPQVWRRAVEALVASTAVSGQPWSCVGGEIDLVVGEQAATLTVVGDDGRAITREVASPDDVQPLGEALLAKPLPMPSEVEAKSGSKGEKTAPAPKPAPTKESEAPTPLREPRVLLSMLVGPRYAGPASLLWGGFSLAATLPPRPWGGGVWLRYDALSAPLDERPPPVRELCVGAAAVRAFGLGPVELRAALRPSLAVVMGEAERATEGTTAPRVPAAENEVGLDFRLGAEAQVVVPIVRVLRAVFALDGEFAPTALGRAPRLPHDDEVEMPHFTLGLGVGVEVAIP